MENKLVLLDKDGTIIRDKHYLGRFDDWKKNIEIYPPASRGIRLIKENDFRVAVISNQAGVARGYLNCERVKEIDREIDRRLKKEGARIDSWYFCPYVDFEYAKRKGIELPNRYVVENPRCRKPNIGMAEDACNDVGWRLNETNIYVIGDKQSDVETAINVGGKGYLVDMEKHPERFLGICREITQENGR